MQGVYDTRADIRPGGRVRAERSVTYALFWKATRYLRAKIPKNEARDVKTKARQRNAILTQNGTQKGTSQATCRNKDLMWF